MPDHEAPRRARGPISIQQVGAETLIYDERSHKAFCLNESSSAIWNLADGERSIAQIAAESSRNLRIPLNEELVCFALEQLRQDGLIEPSSRPEPTSTVTRRSMLQKLGVGGAMLLPAVAAILAPTAAQAYSGCVDCDVQPAKARRLRQPIPSRPLLIPDPSDPSQ
jgi:hypothetical protein